MRVALNLPLFALLLLEEFLSYLVRVFLCHDLLLVQVDIKKHLLIGHFGKVKLLPVEIHKHLFLR